MNLFLILDYNIITILHRKNMIQLLFRIRKRESAYKFNKAKLYFEVLTKTAFKIDHFSEMIYEKNK